jgi:hypothetical protein
LINLRFFRDVRFRAREKAKRALGSKPVIEEHRTTRRERRHADWSSNESYTGIFELYRGKPEIKVLSMSQIKGPDSQPVAQ